MKLFSKNLYYNIYQIKNEGKINNLGLNYFIILTILPDLTCNSNIILKQCCNKFDLNKNLFYNINKIFYFRYPNYLLLLASKTINYVNIIQYTFI